jgi:glycosyltransferase involved in cell wall biosynthesis
VEAAQTESATGTVRAAHTPVSVVIAAYNEVRYIGRCVRSLQAQTHRPLELIVVDDGSRDGTADVLARFEGVRLLRQPHLGAGRARNTGARVATGEILVFVDADMEFPPQFVARLVAPMLENGAIGTFTREIMVANGDRRWARAHMLGRFLPADCHFPAGFPDRWENFRAIRRDAFWAVGGFDAIGHGEDVTVGRKLGIPAEIATGAICFHHEPDRLSEIFRSARWFGRGERIREQPNPISSYLPWRTLRRAVGLARRHRMPSLFVYRLVWDAGVLLGLLQGRAQAK